MSAHDIRSSGFIDRAPAAAAWAWLDGYPAAPKTCVVPPDGALGRVLAQSVVVGSPPSPRLQSAENGYAVRAADCDGATAYNPLMLVLHEPGVDELPAGSTCPIATGWTLPAGADAVLPLEAAQLGGARSLEVLAPVAPGSGTTPRAGKFTLQRGHRLRPQDVSCLAAMGVAGVPVLRRPRVGIVVPGAKSGPDTLTLLLRALLARDEALTEVMSVNGGGEPALASALTHSNGCDLVLLAGRSGAGLDDTAALAVHAAGGSLALHGIALHPGGSAGLGTLRGGNAAPIILLPGEPFACLVAYDMLAARFVRRLAGADPAPYPVAEFELSRKVVSGIGRVEIVPVRLTGNQAQPVGADASLAATVQADGFVVVAAASEGYAPGARVRVHLYGGQQAEAIQDMVS